MSPKKSVTPSPKPPTVDRRSGLKHLGILRRNGESLTSKRPIREESFYAWRASVATCLIETFGEDNMFMLPHAATISNGAAKGDEEAQRFQLATLTVEYVGTIIESFAHELEDESSATQSALPDIMEVFISHSSEDVALAKAFYELLREALNIEQKRIRCTSVPGCKLESGMNFEEILRAETLRSAVFVALVTPSAIESMFTIFEIGARWGSTRRMILFRACGADYQSIGRPLNSLTLTNGTDRSEVIHAIETISGILGKQLSSGAAWDGKLDAFLQLAKIDSKKQAQPPVAPASRFFSDDSGILWAKSDIPGRYEANCPTCRKPMSWAFEGYQCRPCGSFFMQGTNKQPQKIPPEFK